MKHQDNTSHQGYQNPSDDEGENIYDKSVNPTANMVLEELAQKYIDTISRINF